MADLKFLKDFEKQISSLEGVTDSSQPPQYWHSTGNLVLNKIISGDINKGIPQGRLTGVVGPSASGKSFLLGNMVKSAQDDGAYCLLIDSENALDDAFMAGIGVDVTSGYNYKSVLTINHVIKIVSSFIKGYKKEYEGEMETAPKIFIGMDSLDMLLTDTEVDHYNKGVIKGDQGQKNKQLKAMLKSFVQDVKNTNITMVVSGQVYKNQDLLNGEGTWIVSDAVRYSLSQIVLVTKLNLKNDKANPRDITGMKMKCTGFKTRFTKEKQNVTLEVPYETGMNKFSGLLEVLQELKIVTRAGSRYKIVGTDESFYSKDLDQYAPRLLDMIADNNEVVSGEFIEGTEDKTNETSKTRKVEKFLSTDATE